MAHDEACLGWLVAAENMQFSGMCVRREEKEHSGLGSASRAAQSRCLHLDNYVAIVSD